MSKNREDVQGKRQKRAEEELRILKEKPQVPSLSAIDVW
jgi:hypothetical protein